MEKKLKSKGQFLKAFGANLRTIRNKHGLSQHKLAELAGLDKNQIGNMERGEHAASVDIIRILAEVLDEDINNFFNFKY